MILKGQLPSTPPLYQTENGVHFLKTKHSLCVDRIQCELPATSDTLNSIYTLTALIASRPGVLPKMTHARSNDRERENCCPPEHGTKLQKKCIQISQKESFMVEE